MPTLAIDIETYSSVDISKSGAYKYAESPDFEILLFAYAFDNEPVEVIDLAQYENMPNRVFYALTDPNIVKTAHNAAFERICINKYFSIDIPPEQWQCTMVHSAMCGLPLALDQVAKVLKLTEQKDSEGKALIRFFCQPRKATSTNPSTRNLPQDFPEKWSKFIEYCRQDVVVEREIRKKVSFYEIPATERELWCLDQRINDRGVMLDLQFISNAIRMDSENRVKLEAEAVALTGLENPNSIQQVKAWLETEMGTEVTDMTKNSISDMLSTVDADNVKRMLQIRQEMSKTSIKKYAAMVACAGVDGRARGLLQYYGANRTGRWAGRLVQVQNLPRIGIKHIDTARQAVCGGDNGTLDLLYDNVPDTLSQLIRTSFIAKPGHRFIVADFSAIECRVISWLAGEEWVLDVFRTHGKIYEAAASRMFNVPIAEIGKDSPLRQKGKVATLALGYQGGPKALEAMGALKQGLTEPELKPIVDAWRKANPKIVQFWYNMQDAAITAVMTGEPVTMAKGLKFFTQKGILFIELPSGRRLSYLRPKIVEGQYGPQLSYEGLDQVKKKWGKEYTYGGKLAENATQAIARDCLAYAMQQVHELGYNTVLHVHDEIVIEAEDSFGSLKEVEAVMAKEIWWAKGLPLNAEGFESKYYKK